MLQLGGDRMPPRNMKGALSRAHEEEHLVTPQGGSGAEGLGVDGMMAHEVEEEPAPLGSHHQVGVPSGEEAAEAVLEAAVEAAAAQDGIGEVEGMTLPDRDVAHPQDVHTHYTPVKSSGNAEMPRARSYTFQLQHCKKYGLRLKENENGSSEPELVVCRFCETFGREPQVVEGSSVEADEILKASMKRRKTSPEEFKANKFYISNVSAHMHKQHPKKWAEYDAVCRAGNEDQINQFFKVPSHVQEKALKEPSKGPRRNYTFQWQHAIRFGLRVRAHRETGEPVAVVCRFCESFGRDPIITPSSDDPSAPPKAARGKRRRADVEEFQPDKFYVSNVRMHMNKIHGKKWAEYEKLLATANDKALQDFFVDEPPQEL
ncbi:hypothetical protein FVE85_0460 [Porphyridium purpureum]|uniref:Uncharacterized protein n=1 Tax=Porphyridium purpureum TaxID=35688 RepID=A0A5J4YYN9_PORPP|nr:hypothetical protein FVE85_0460 [Porphyridium purpureum]|eukprot:POR8276..scf208_2